MKRRYLPSLIYSVCLVVGITGCQPIQPRYLGESGNLQYYVDKATQVSYPDVTSEPLEEVTQGQAPVTLRNPTFGNFWDLSLEDSVSIALQNAKIIRGYGTPALQGTTVAPGADTLVNNPQGAGTTFNVAIRESEPGFIATPGQIGQAGTVSSNTALESNQGVEAALAEFDTHFTTSIYYEKSDRPRNTIPANPFSPTVFLQDSVNFRAELAKKAATGTQFFFRNTTDYTANNVPAAFQPLGSFYTTALEAGFTQPLARGRGTFINRMPVIMARIGTDQEIANLESQLQNMLCNVEIRYWNLQAAYRNYEAARIGQDSAQSTVALLQDKFEVREATEQDLAAAKEQYYSFRAQTLSSLNDLQEAEANLRWLMGLSANDGRLIRPTDEPTTALIEFDWDSISGDALVRRPELRLERWELKKKELQLAYAKNSLLPQVNAVALYRWLGMGDELVAANRSGINFPNAGSRAWEGLTEGDYQEFRLGLEMGLPIGLRRELANVRNAQAKLAREKARIEDMELDAIFDLHSVTRAIVANYELAIVNLNRWQQSQIEVGQRQIQLKGGVITINEVLDSQRRLANSQVAYYNSVIEYNKSIALLHRYKGTTLDFAGIDFEEGPWPGKAYDDATDHARRRSASRKVNYGYTRPNVVSMNGMPYSSGETIIEGGEYVEEMDSPEVLPGTSPTPVQPTPEPIDSARKTSMNTSVSEIAPVNFEQPQLKGSTQNLTPGNTLRNTVFEGPVR